LSAPIDDAKFLQYTRDIGGILSLTRTPPLIVVRRKEENNYEAEEVKEKDPATRETSARRLREIDRVETQTAAGGDSKGVESRQKIGCPRYCISRKEISGVNVGREETQEETKSFTGAPCATCSRDESPMGCEESCRGE
jgi:hypothetical protein